MKLVVTIPALNEAATIGKVVGEIPRRIPGVDVVEVIVMNDGSTDETAQIAADAGAMVFNLTGRRGLGHVFRCSMDRAIRLGADVIVNIDGDGQFNSTDVPRLLEPILQGKADFVTCTRFGDADGPRGMPAVKYLGNRSVTWLINQLGNLKLSDVSCGFRAYNREAAYRLSQFGRWTYVEECLLDLASKGLRIAQVPLEVKGEREHGQSRVARSVIQYGTNLTQILLRVVRDTRPLAFFGTLAVIFGVIGFAVIGFLVVWLLLHGRTTPFTSLVSISGAIVTVAFLLLVLGLLADMVGRHRRLTEELLYLARRKFYGVTTRKAPAEEPPARPAIPMIVELRDPSEVA